MNKRYAVEYLSQNKSCTTGTPNIRTGRMSKAVNVKCFDNKEDLVNWISKSYHNRDAVTKRTLRSLCLGDTQQEFELFLETL